MELPQTAAFDIQPLATTTNTTLPPPKEKAVPAGAVCVACRERKVKCKRGDEDDSQCLRCVRLGIPCVPTAPSQRGKRSSHARLRPSNRARLLDEMPLQASNDKHLTPVEPRKPIFVKKPLSCDEFVAMWDAWVGDMSHAMQHLVVLMASWILHRNQYHFLPDAVAICKYYHFCEATVLEASSHATQPPANIDDYPPEFTQMLNTSSGYVMARCVTTRRVSHQTNRSFDVAVASKAELDGRFTEGRIECGELFGLVSEYVHGEDQWLICKHVMSSMGMDGEAGDGVLSFVLPVLVRIADRRLFSHVPCSVRVMRKWGSASHALFVAVEFTPAGPPEPYVSARAPLNFEESAMKLVTHIKTMLNISGDVDFSSATCRPSAVIAHRSTSLDKVDAMPLTSLLESLKIIDEKLQDDETNSSDNGLLKTLADLLDPEELTDLVCA